MDNWSGRNRRRRGQRPLVGSKTIDSKMRDEDTLVEKVERVYLLLYTINERKDTDRVKRIMSQEVKVGTKMFIVLK